MMDEDYSRKVGQLGTEHNLNCLEYDKKQTGIDYHVLYGLLIKVTSNRKMSL